MMTEGDNGAAPGGWGRTLRVVGSSARPGEDRDLDAPLLSSHRVGRLGIWPEQQNRAFCEKYGMPFGTHAHISCIEDLMDIRANERQRTLDEFGMC